MKYQPFAFWLVAIIVGILLQHFYDFNQKLIWSVLLFSCLIFSLIYFLKLSRTILFLSGFCVLICIGGVRYFQFNSQSNEDFQLPKEDQFYYLQVENQIKPSEKFEKYYAKILATENPSDSSLLGQKILVYLRHQPVAIHNKDRFWVHSKLMEIPSSQNPYAFDYQAYMKNKRVYFQLFANEFISLEHGK